MVPENRLRAARLVSLAASMCIALSAGTNYVYSAYAPQLAERLQLTATESNLIGICGNLGMNLAGIPNGMFIDAKGPRLPVLLGAVLLFSGYYPIYNAMHSGQGSTSVLSLCFFSFLTGVGSSASFGGAIKAAALNFPNHRGTATAIPLAAFGLSAFFFSSLSSWLFPGNTSDFLLVLATATSSIVLLSYFFLRVVPVPGAYSIVPPAELDYTGSSRLHRTKSGESRSAAKDTYQEPGTSTSSRGIVRITNPDCTPDESSSFLTNSSSSSDEDRIDAESTRGGVIGSNDHAYHTDIRGWALTKSTDFWLLFTLLGLLTGTGLMTINNIGHSVQALWQKYAPDTHPDYVQQRQGFHVSLLSIGSFSGRIMSGTSSDILYKNYGLQRIWLVVVSAVIFCFSQIFALNVENPHQLWLVSFLSGLGYGVLFGVFPTITSETFGLHGLSQNWGTMTVSAIISGQIFNMFYGRIYDDHSNVTPEGTRECTLGLECYRDSYWITLGAVLIGLVLALMTIQRNRRLAVQAGNVRHAAGP
ncbi:MFS general substrate transporter [Morchella conica CCBAS932]|uniref:MFS general substrate transporter n=1 Tax=Morchella conica CCBAS932 TaxID=1392247 RepID=A0A3N4KMG1_9PEZI|nr:MFS general substrate transporter [Morchella conica CCBAS932]